VGASRGSVIIWKGSSFKGTSLFQNSFAQSIEFSSLHNGVSWILTNIYAPCTPSGKRDFLRWFKNVQMPSQVDRLIVGDFNLYRSPEDRNKPRADVAEMFLFNEAISKLGLVELPLKGKRFTWTNKQFSPLLEHLDWFFTSSYWTLNYPHTTVFSLTMETFDHAPCLICVTKTIPKSRLFRFENFWMHHLDFLEQVQLGWTSTVHQQDAAMCQRHLKIGVIPFLVSSKVSNE
jgi:hypothetical protein